MNCLKSITQNKETKLFLSRVNMSGSHQGVPLRRSRKEHIGIVIFVAAMVGVGVMHATINKSL